MQNKIFTKVHGVKCDFPDTTGKRGTTTTNNVAQEVLYRKCNCDVTLSQQTKLFINLASSCMGIYLFKRKVRIELYKEYCTKSHFFLIDNFPRVTNKHLPGHWSVSPQYHKVLAHTRQLIEINNECGLWSTDRAELERSY